MEHPAMPVHWGANQSGMQAFTELSPEDQIKAQELWLKGRDEIYEIVEQMTKVGDTGVHKQITNRLTEPWGVQRVLCSFTGTEAPHFFALRNDIHAQPEIRKIAEMMQEIYEAATPKALAEGQWHLPLIYDDDRKTAAEQYPDDPNALIKISTGRCARVSYLTHDGKRDLSKDIELHDILTQNGHMSPAEHVAKPLSTSELSLVRAMREVLDKAEAEGTEVPFWMQNQLGYAGNFRGWVQYRKTLRHEHDFSKVKAELAAKEAANA